MTERFSILKRKLGLYRKPIFDCFWNSNSPDSICVHLMFGENFIIVNLTRKQWKHLRFFLNKTITQIKFPKEHEGFSGFDIPANKISYYSHNRQVRICVKKDRPYANRVRFKLKREKVDILKFKLAKELWFDFNSAQFVLKRKWFYMFREKMLKSNAM